MILAIAITIAAALFWSGTNLIHKVMASRLINSVPVLIFLFSIVVIIFGTMVGILFPESFGPIEWLWLATAALANIIGTWLYYWSMRRFEASRIVPLFGIGSLGIIVLSAIFLGEIFGGKTYLGIALILGGSILITIQNNFFEFFSSRLLWAMTASGLAFAANVVVVKHLVLFHSPYSVFAFIAVLQGTITLILLIPFYRSIIEIVRGIAPRILWINLFNETLSNTGTLLYIIALSLWYASLVETVATLQYAFIFLMVSVVSRLRPQFLKEEMNRPIIIRKISAIALIIIGLCLVT